MQTQAYSADGGAVVVIQSSEDAEQSEGDESKDPYERKDTGAIEVLRLGAQDRGASLRKTPRENRLTRTGLKLGTAGYMSPEQVRGEALDARTDIFSFGLVLYEMATGERAFAGETEAILHDAIVNREPRPVRELAPKLSPKMEEIIGKCLSKRRERRYPSAAELCKGLMETSGGRRTIPKSFPRLLVLTTIMVVACIAGGLLWKWKASRARGELTATDTIIISEFENLTGDPAFDDGLRTALYGYLYQSPFFHLISERKVRSALKSLNRREDDRLTLPVSRELCQQTNSRAVVTGSISDAGNRYSINLAALDCRGGATMATSYSEAESRQRVIAALGESAALLRKKLGEPQLLRNRYGVRPEQAYTSSPEALQAYAQTLKYSDKVAQLKHAVELDPLFGIAFYNLGLYYHAVHSDVLAAENWSKAYTLRGRLTEQQRFHVDTTYFYGVTGELEKYIAALEEYLRIYSLQGDDELERADQYMALNLSLSYYALGQHEKALEKVWEQLQIVPDSYCYMALLRVDLALNRFEAAKAASDDARARNVDGPNLRVSRYGLAFLLNNKKFMQEQLAWARGMRLVENWLLSAASDTEAYYGRLSNAREVTRRAVQSAINADQSESAAIWKGQAALREAEVGNVAGAEQLANEAQSMSSATEVKVLAGLTFSTIGQVETAQKVAEKLDRDRPADTSIQAYWLPTIRGSIALSSNNPLGSIEVLKRAAPYEMGGMGFKQEPFGNLYPVYVRGKAYLAAGRPQLAAVEFQKIFDHRGLVGNFIIGALARFQLGRAQVMMGDKVAARKSYEDFLTLWKDADPDIPIYKQAKAEYAKLH